MERGIAAAPKGNNVEDIVETDSPQAMLSFLAGARPAASPPRPRSSSRKR